MEKKKFKIKPKEIIILIVFIAITSFAVINVKDLLKDKELSESVDINYVVSDNSDNKENATPANSEKVDETSAGSKNFKIVVPGDAIAVVHIPSVGIVGKIANGTDENTLKKYVGKFDGSVEPGKVGNFAIAAHNNVYTEIFRKLYKVKVEDEVKIITRETEYTYKVKTIQTVLPDDISVLRNTDKTEITLITCNTTASKRVVVKGELISQKAI